VKQLYCIVGWTEWMARCKFWEGWFFPSLKFIAFKLGLDHKTHWRAQAFALTSNRFCHLDLFADRPTAQVHRLKGCSIDSLRQSYLA
jgi:hypothetical protein